MDRDRFERLYSEHAQPLFGFLAYRTGDRSLAEDLLGDTFERVLTARRGYNPRRASEKTWLYSIALNLLRDHLRRAAAEQRALDRVGAPVNPEGAATLDLVDERDALQRALGTLSDEEREAVALRYGADLSVPEMANALGEKLTTVEGRVYRAIRKLRAELEPASSGGT
jgi:RNA polymerase sigma factor (sigma-70 family)